MNAEELSAVAGVMLSVGCSYLPGINEKFNLLDPTHKRLVMLGLLVLATLGVFGLSCLDAGLSPVVQCSRTGAWGLARAFGLAVVANQAAFQMSPKV
jgi:hypothetical protein